MPRTPGPKRVVVISVGLAVALGCAHETAKPQTSAFAAPASTARASAPAPAHAPQLATAMRPSRPRDGSIYFDFDSAMLDGDARSTLQKVAAGVPRDQNDSLVIEGNCDELGTIEYNLALGEERARSAKDYLTHLGVPSGEIRTLSYGSQRPKYEGHDDLARAKNRRDDIRLQ